MKDLAKKHGIKPGDKVWGWDHDFEQQQSGIFLGYNTMYPFRDEVSLENKDPNTHPYLVSVGRKDLEFMYIRPYDEEKQAEQPATAPAEEKPCKFYVGQKVRDHVLFPDRGVGTIKAISVCSIGVLFEGEYRQYCGGGNYHSSYIPTLVDASEGFDLHIPAPEPEFERGERVLVRDYDDLKWVSVLYGNKYDGPDPHYTMEDMNGVGWIQCRKWDPDLIGKVTE